MLSLDQDPSGLTSSFEKELHGRVDGISDN